MDQEQHPTEALQVLQLDSLELNTADHLSSGFRRNVLEVSSGGRSISEIRRDFTYQPTKSTWIQRETEVSTEHFKVDRCAGSGDENGLPISINLSVYRVDMSGATSLEGELLLKADSKIYLEAGQKYLLRAILKNIAQCDSISFLFPIIDPNKQE